MTDVVFRPEPELEEAPASEEQIGRFSAASISVLALTWIAASAIFVALRLGVIWHSPVGGAELAHLSGAWLARIGSPDDRFVPTLFQAVTTLTLHWTDSPIPARTIAFLSSATVPLALVLLRRHLTDAGAIVTLLLLALDGLSIAVGSSASAMGFDVAITVWLFVIAVRGGVPRWCWPIIGFLVASAGPMPLPLIAAWLGLNLVRKRYPALTETVLCASGIILAVLLSSLRYGLGLDGLRIAPFQLFADAYSQAWTSNTTFDLLLIYSAPVILGGIAAGAATVYRLVAEWDADGQFDSREPLTLAWAGVALLWAISSSASHAIIPLVAVTTPMAFLLGPALVRGLGAMVAADWSVARFVIPVALFVALVYATATAGWLQNNNGPSNMAIVVGAALVLAAVACWLWLRRQPAAAAALLTIPIVIGAFPFISGGLGIAFSGVGEPVPSPISTPQAHDLRNILEADLAHTGGPLVVDPSLWNDLTWPLRDSGNVVIASQIPANAGAAIVPEDAAKPAGMVPLQGQWTITESTSAATADLGEYFHWFTNRGVATTSTKAVAVYVRPNP